MIAKHTPVRVRSVDVPYDPKRRKATAAFWATATAHSGLNAWRAACSGQPKAAEDREALTALHVETDPSD
jgi:hypothetical protein